MFEFLEDIEINWTAVALVLGFSLLFWAIIWLNPLWKQSTAFDFKVKLIMSILLPIISYPFVARQLSD